MSSPEARSRPLLAFDTSGDPASVALFLGDGSRRVAVAPVGRRAGDVLHVLVRDLLREAGCALGEAGLIAAVRGPGSFTGLRVGLAAASGLALVTGAAVAGVETTRAIAQASGREGRILVVLEAGQGRLAFARHERIPGGDAAPVEGPLDLTPDEVVERLREPADHRLVRGAPASQAILVAAGCEPFDGPLAEAAAELARALGPEAGPLEALYARPPAIRPAR
jgi:tRNA threonylcarbamoyladenosine biosynthesis protein TsaB